MVFSLPHGEESCRKLLTDLVSVHLVDCHLGALAVHKLDKAASLARRDLDVGNVSKHGEAVPELVLMADSRETANKDGGVVGIVVLARGVLRASRLNREAVSSGGHSHVVVHVHVGHAAHTANSHVASVGVVHVVVVVIVVVHAHLVLGCGHRDADGAATTVDAWHLVKSTHLLTLVRESHKSIA